MKKQINGWSAVLPLVLAAALVPACSGPDNRKQDTTAPIAASDAGSGAVPGAAGTSGQGSGAATGAQPTSGTAGQASSATGDTDFVQHAAMGGMAEVQLGRLAAKQAASADVKRFGQRMVTDHSKANTELKSLAAKKKITLPTALDEKHQSLVTKLSALKGADFDREYMSAMVDDHQEDVSLFERESNSGEDAALKQWAAKTLPTLQAHYKMAQDIAAKVSAQK